MENSDNSLPIGYPYDRIPDNIEILKIICSNVMRMRISNQRTLDGPIRSARGTRELLASVEDLCGENDNKVYPGSDVQDE